MTGSRTCSTKVQKKGARLSEVKTWFRRALHARLSEIDFFSPSFLFELMLLGKSPTGPRGCVRLCPNFVRPVSARGSIYWPRRLVLGSCCSLCSRPLFLPRFRSLWSQWLGAGLDFVAARHAGRKMKKCSKCLQSETSRTHGWPRLRFYNVKTPIRDGPHTLLALQRRAARPNGAARLCTRPKGAEVAQWSQLRRVASHRTLLRTFCPPIPLRCFRAIQ